MRRQFTNLKEGDSPHKQAEELRKDNSPLILVVDDSPDVLQMLSDILTHHGYQVRTASSGRLALRSVAVELPDLILLDVKLPDLDGYEVCHLLKSEEQSRGIPVIFISGRNDTADKVEGFNAGGVDYIAKPFQLAEVLARVELHLTLRHLQKQLEAQNIQLQQEINKRDRIEKELAEQKSHMEELVAERTADLKNINEELQRKIVECKQSEEAIIESEERYRTTLDNTQEGYFEVNLAGNFTFVNDAQCNDLGYTREELIGMNYKQYTDEKTTKKEYELFNRIYRTGEQIKGFEGEFIKKNGTKGFNEISVSVIRNKEGKPVGFRGLSRDITKRKQTEAELFRVKEETEVINRQLEEAIEQANRLAIEAEVATIAKSDFLASMSHEIRTPMNGVMGMTSLLLETELTAEQRDYAETVQTSASTLLAIINDILDFSKIEAQKLDMEMIDFDLKTTVEDVTEMLAIRAQEKGLEFACLVDHNIPFLLKGDPGRLRQILINLAGNAIKFTAAGEVLIHVTLEHESDTEATVQFKIKDTGIGIPKERMNRLFQSFSQVDSSITRKYGGTGLGLAISKKLTEMMDGQIGVESEEGKGSTFWFMIPFKKQPAKSQNRQPVLVNLQDHRILVVDDNATNRLVLHEYLRHWNCPVTEASNGKEAIAKLREASAAKTPFDVAILEMKMADIDGITLGRQIKGDPHLRDTVLVMVTSLGQRGDARLMKEIGFAAYLTKPVKATHLSDCLALAIAGKRSAEEASPAPLITRHVIEEQKRQKIRILLAEDNITNQKVAMKMLEKRGYVVDVVDNGQKAVKALGTTSYDLVLMDVQMPEMDGFEATAVIRRKELGTVMHIPIIAMTAHAMRGDRERCLEMGMDDYVSKPIQIGELNNAIERLLFKEMQPGKEPSKPIQAANEMIFDENALMERIDGDIEIMKEIIDTFLDDAPGRLEQLRQALEDHDTAAVKLIAHSLKGASANIEARAMRQIAFEIEQHHEDIERIRPQVEKLSGAFGALQTYLKGDDF